MTTPSQYAQRASRMLKEGRIKGTRDWDTNWLITAEDDFTKLPDAAQARHHDGWRGHTATSSPVSETMEDAPSHPPTPPPSSSQTHGKEMERIMRSRLGVPYPEVLLPIPSLEMDFRLAVKLRKEVCNVCSDDGEAKELTVVESGTWAGSFGKGFVKVGGHDLQPSQLTQKTRSRVDTAFELVTDEESPAKLELRTRGYISYLPGALQTILMGNMDDSTSYAFRMVMSLRTQDPRYAETVNLGLWIGSGAWKGNELILDSYRVS